MFHRMLAAVLSLVLAWASITTQENFASLVSPADDPVVLSSLDHRQSLADGSVDDHHLDDQPGSVSAEHGDHPVVLPIRHVAWTPLLDTTRPRPLTEAASTPVDPRTPQRPPCSNSVAA